MLEAGQQLQGRYLLKRQLGQNAGRQTWLAEDLGIQPSELVVVKVLELGGQVQWDSLKLFEREAAILKQLDHPRIPKCRDYFTIDDRVLWFGLVQDYIPGRSLRELMGEGRRFSEAETQTIAGKVLQILAYLHELNPPVLHRDIKPSNLILGDDDQIYLIDFGAVQDRAIKEGSTFTVVGTYGYTPIEQFGGRAVEASDLYALGASLAHLLTGIAPADLPQRNLKLQFRDYVNISPAFLRWIEQLVEPDLDQRFRTAKEAIEALLRPQAVGGTLDTRKPHGSRVEVRRSRSELEIRVPGRGIRGGDAFIIMWLTIWYGITIPFGIFAFPFILIFWIAGLFPLGILVFPAFGETYLRFDRDTFLMEWRLFGYRYRQQQGPTAAIQSVFQSQENMKVNEQPVTTVAIQAGAQEYKFGGFAPSLVVSERQWLVHEIGDWLGLEGK
ncbi:serine/threonine protein kinase [Egbenema bharatensis]|uniref:serine/threonine protein kinase n=1 Tax=Egbenema bharatensis TaxID=3463334 RepID=UPI003A839FF3